MKEPRKYSQITIENRPELEKLDCVVRSISIVAEIDYMEAHAIVKGVGRRDRCRTEIKKSALAAKEAGLEVIVFPKQKQVTVRKFLDNWPFADNEKVIVSVLGHWAPVIGGVESDITRKPVLKDRQKVKRVIVKKGTSMIGCDVLLNK